jgi:hypothetical protein
MGYKDQQEVIAETGGTARVNSERIRALQCRKEVKGIRYYSPEDCTLGQVGGWAPSVASVLNLYLP